MFYMLDAGGYTQKGVVCVCVIDLAIQDDESCDSLRLRSGSGQTLFSP